MALEDVAHIVVLMLENRSFDCMLRKLYPTSLEFDGLSGTETNEDVAGTRCPDPDPGELFIDMNMQLFGSSKVTTPAPVPTMSGFVKSCVSPLPNLAKSLLRPHRHGKRLRER